MWSTSTVSEPVNSRLVPAINWHALNNKRTTVKNTLHTFPLQFIKLQSITFKKENYLKQFCHSVVINRCSLCKLECGSSTVRVTWRKTNLQDNNMCISCGSNCTAPPDCIHLLGDENNYTLYLFILLSSCILPEPSNSFLVTESWIPAILSLPEACLNASFGMTPASFIKFSIMPLLLNHPLNLAYNLGKWMNSQEATSGKWTGCFITRYSNTICSVMISFHYAFWINTMEVPLNTIFILQVYLSIYCDKAHSN